MELDRKIIKNQAKKLIKNYFIRLFSIEMVIMILIYTVTCMNFAVGKIYEAVENRNEIYKTINDFFYDYDYDYDYNYNYNDNDNDYFDSFKFNEDNEYENNDFFNFGTDMKIDANSVATELPQMPYEQYDDDTVFPTYPYENSNQYEYSVSGKSDFVTTFALVISRIFDIAQDVSILFLSPLTIALAGTYVAFIRGKRFNSDEAIKGIIQSTFKNNYFKRFLLVFLRSLFTGLLMILCVVPGIVYHYSTYMAEYIMSDNPELSPIEALRLSRKMNKDFRFELFYFDLSFIPWYLLCLLVAPIIYALPYIRVTRALYYENFRLRALQMGRVSEDDFLSDAQKRVKYANYYNQQHTADGWQQYSNAQQSSANPNGTEQSSANPNGTEQNSANPNSTEQNDSCCEEKAQQDNA